MWGTFRAKNSGLCIDVDGFYGTLNVGSNLHMNACEAPLKSTTDHAFKMDSNGFIINQKSKYCINLQGGSDTDSKYITDRSVIFVYHYDL